MDLVALASVVVTGAVAAMTQFGRRGDRKHIEHLRVLDWEHGRSGRRREAYQGALEQGSLLLDAEQSEPSELSKATSTVELYGSTRAAELWRQFTALVRATDVDARHAYEAFADQARREDSRME